jgi:hypothetical protein
MQTAGRCILLSGVQDDAYAALSNVGIVAEVGADRVFRERPQVWSSTLQAIQWAYEKIGENRCDNCPRRSSITPVDEDWSFMI